MNQLAIFLVMVGIVSVFSFAGCSGGDSESDEHRIGAESREHEGESEGAEHNGGGEADDEGEESAAQFASDETFDEVRAGVRLVLSYDLAANHFRGSVENTTGATLSQVRMEVPLSNGVELGPTAPVDLETRTETPCFEE